jgi:glucose-6-phosphate isomerase
VKNFTYYNPTKLIFGKRQLEEVKQEVSQYGKKVLLVYGGVPNLVVSIPEMDAYTFGYLVYFFEKACAISDYLLGVNPFDQQGAEAYKVNIFTLLGKSGYEEKKVELEKRLNH